MEHGGALDVTPLRPDTWDALSALFQQGGDPKRCWCTFWRVPGGAWTQDAPEANCDLLRELTWAGGLAPGLVARRDGEAVGWVSLGPRGDFERLARSRTIPLPPGDGVWSVVCLVVGRRHRRHGVTSRLLEAAEAWARDEGAAVLEAYPVDTRGERLPAANAYTGTLPMFERAGFTVVSPTTSRAGGGFERVVVRKPLASRPATA